VEKSASGNISKSVIRVIGVGQPFAGDDGVGFEIAGRLRQQIKQLDVSNIEEDASSIEVLRTTDSTTLIYAFKGASKVIIVDAVKGGGSPGDVLRLTPETLCQTQAVPVSTHGLSVIDAIELSKIFMAEQAELSREKTEIVIIGVVVEDVKLFDRVLSESVARAIPKALEMCWAALPSRRPQKSYR